MPIDRAVRSLPFAESSHRQPPPTVACCPVDAAGVAAEWVEATVATPDQNTLVIFAGEGRHRGPFHNARRYAGILAVETGARVLVIGTRPGTTRPADVIRDSLDAYAWLLGEGLDLDTTTLIGPNAEDGGKALTRAAQERGLPVPETVIGIASRGDLTRRGSGAPNMTGGVSNRSHGRNAYALRNTHR